MAVGLELHDLRVFSNPKYSMILHYTQQQFNFGLHLVLKRALRNISVFCE